MTPDERSRGRTRGGDRAAHTRGEEVSDKVILISLLLIFISIIALALIITWFVK